MKYVIVIPDGCADEAQESLGGKTPLQAARKPNMDRVARTGVVGRSNNVPAPLTPASDVATLSLFGYDPLAVYTGRAPLETAAMGIPLGPNDWAIRCNLVHVENGEMRDFTAGHITSEEGGPLIEAVHAALGGPVSGRPARIPPRRQLPQYPRFSSRQVGPLLRRHEDAAAARHPGQTDRRPSAEGAGRASLLRDLMERSRAVLAEHPVNKARIAKGKRPATQIWLWGQGKAPTLEPFDRKYGKRGAIISAVDLVRGVGVLLGWKRIDVPGATGYLDTDYAAKGRYAVAALPDHDLVCVHVEAPDEASHEGKADEKVKALERIDEHIVGPLLEALPRHGEWRILVSPDHRTPLRTRAHAYGMVPFTIAGSGIASRGQSAYDEAVAEKSDRAFEKGHELMRLFLG